jgi:hypothetical protein
VDGPETGKEASFFNATEELIEKFWVLRVILK